MKRILLATDVPFWECLKGNQQRVFKLIAFLAEHYSVTVFFMGYETPETGGIPIYFKTMGSHSRRASIPWRVLNGLPNRLRFTIIEFLNRIGYRRTLKSFYRAELLQAFAHFYESSDFDAVIIEYVWYGFLADAVDRDKSLLLLDFHDLYHQRVESYGRFNRVPDRVITREEELAVFEKFDYLIALQRADFDFLSGLLPGKLLVTMHPHRVFPEVYQQRLATGQTRDKLSLVYFGAFSDASLDSVRWFIRHVWANDLAQLYVLNIYGTVCEALTVTAEGVILKGRVETVEEVYRNADVAVNPARFGSGLKIRNIEAMAFGVPMVTTFIGAQGLEAHKDELFLVANEPDEFRRQLIRLAEPEIRRSMSAKALAFVGEHLTPEACFGGLKLAIDQGVRERG